MIIIWGSTTKSKHVEYGQFVCPGCQRPSDYEITGVYKYFTLFFIPLFQTKQLGKVVVCGGCQRSFAADVLDDAPLQEAAGRTRRARAWKCQCCGDRNPTREKSCRSCASPAPALALDDADFFEPEPRQAPAVPLAAPKPHAAHATAETSPLALVSLIVGLLSPLLVCACGLSLFTSLAAIITGHLARARIRKSNGQVIGGGMATIGLLAGYVSLLLTAGYFAFLFTRPDKALAGPQDPAREAFNLAEREIGSDRNGVSHGNSPQARQLAELYRKMLSELDDAAFDRPGLKAFRGKYDVWCELHDGQCAFLVHVPDYRKFEDDARDSLAELTWLVAQSAAQEALQPGDQLAVGLKGDILWGDVMVGSMAASDAIDNHDPETKTSSQSDLYSFFIATAGDKADRPQPAAAQNPADPKLARRLPFQLVDPATGRPLFPLSHPPLPVDPAADPRFRKPLAPQFPVPQRGPPPEGQPVQAPLADDSARLEPNTVEVPVDQPESAAVQSPADSVTGEQSLETTRPPETRRERTSIFPENLEEALEFLASDDTDVRQRGINWLHSHPPETPNPDVAGKLIALLQDEAGGESFVMAMAVQAWATDEQLPDLKQLLKHENVLVRQKILETISGLKTKASADVLIDLLSDADQRVSASIQLQQMGEVAEESVLKLLRNPDADIRQEACRILGEVGTTKSMRRLNTLQKDQDSSVRFAAKSAAEKVRARLKEK